MINFQAQNGPQRTGNPKKTERRRPRRQDALSPLDSPLFSQAALVHGVRAARHEFEGGPEEVRQKRRLAHQSGAQLHATALVGVETVKENRDFACR